MIQKQYDFTLDTMHKSNISKMEFVLGDKNTGILNITLTQNDEVLDLASLTIILSVKKSDNTTVIQDVEITNAKQGLIKCVLAEQSITAVGVNLAEISLYEGNKKLTSTVFKYIVRESFSSDETIKSSNEFGILGELTDDVNKLKVEMNDFNTIAKADEQGRIKGEETRKVDELDRKVSEIDRKTSEEERKTKYTQIQEQWRNVSTAVKDSNIGQSVVTEVIAARTNKQAKTYGTVGERIDVIEDKVQSRDYTEIETLGASVVSLPNAVEGQGKIEIQGNTLVNLVQNGDFSKGTTGWEIQNSKALVSNNELNSTATARYGGVVQIIPNAKTYANHKLYFRALVNSPSNDINIILALNDGVGQTAVNINVVNNFSLLSGIRMVDLNVINLYLKLQDGRVSQWDTIKLKEGICIDLTAMYGTGNEPTKEVCDTIQWFEGMKSVDKVEVLSEGRNKFDGLMESGKYSEVDGKKLVLDNSVRSINFIKVDPNRNYVFSQNLTLKGINLKFYDNFKKFISYTTNSKFITPNNCYYITFDYALGYINTENLQLEEGTVVTPYKSYQYDKINILMENKPLNKINDTIYDYIDKSGIKHYNSYKMSFDGSDDEGWKVGGAGVQVNTLYLYPPISSLPVKIFSVGKIISDKFNYVAFGTLYTTDIEGISIGSTETNDGIKIRILKSKLTQYGFVEGTTATYAPSFKAWLQANNTTVIYQTATETTEPLQLDKPLALSSFENGSMVINSNIPVNIKYAYPTNLSSAVSSLRDYTEVLEQQMLGVWKTALGLADRELRMKAVPLLATETNLDLKNKVNEILNIWR